MLVAARSPNGAAMGLAFGFAMLSGCAGTPVLKPIPEGTPLAIATARPATPEEPVPIRNQALGEGASAGMGSGMVIGGLWGLACGPLAPLCVPLGAGMGVVTGGADGAVIGVTGALPDAKAEQLRERLARARKSRDILEDLRVHVTDRASKHWVLDGSPAATTLTLELRGLQLTSTRDERVSLTVQVLATVQRKGSGADPPPEYKLYAYTGPLSALGIWLDDRNDFIDSSLGAASQQLAAELVSELALAR